MKMVMIDTNIFISAALFPNGRAAAALMKALAFPYQPLTSESNLMGAIFLVYFCLDTRYTPLTSRYHPPLGMGTSPLPPVHAHASPDAFPDPLPAPSGLERQRQSGFVSYAYSFGCLQL